MSRVLVVDDKPDVLAAVAQTLRDAGHEVTATDSGSDAVCQLAAKPAPDVILLDFLMPGFTGGDVLAALGLTAPPVILMTGADPGPAELNLGHVARVLRKPFTPEELLAAVDAALGRAPPGKPPEGDCG